MARESFEDPAIAAILNRYFVSIKVDKEQRPDVDSIYMAVCQALTGNGGWPTSIFMTAGQKPFYAGTYFPKSSQYDRIGFKELLLAVRGKWDKDREALLRSADEITEVFNSRQIQAVQTPQTAPTAPTAQTATTQATSTAPEVLMTALRIYKQSFDEEFGGFGGAPKFPAAHNLLFLMQQYQKNAATDNSFYGEAALKTAHYLLAEMTSTDGGFYSAQDADNDGVEGKYYVFEPGEIIELLGEESGAAFNKHYGITKDGNFEGKSIPNLLYGSPKTDAFDVLLPQIREYRRSRCFLHTDDKILTTWNSLMISALCALYRSSHKEEFLKAAIRAQRFIEAELCETDTLYVSIRKGIRTQTGFLDDYACYCCALLSLYDATLDNTFLERADAVAGKAIADFFDQEHGGLRTGAVEFP